MCRINSAFCKISVLEGDNMINRKNYYVRDTVDAMQWSSLFNTE